MRPKRRQTRERQGCDFYDTDRLLHRMMPILLSFFSVWFAIVSLQTVRGETVGVLGTAAVTLAGGCFGRMGALLSPTTMLAAILWARDVRDRRLIGRLGYLLLGVALSAAFLSGGSENVGFSEGDRMVGGGLLGMLLRRGLTALGGELGLAGATLLYIALYLFVFLGFSPAKAYAGYRERITHRGRSAAEEKRKSFRNDGKGIRNAMKFKAGRPTVADDGGYYPIDSAEESFNQIRSRLEREESLTSDYRGGGVVYPESASARSRFDIPVGDEKPAEIADKLKISREPIEPVQKTVTFAPSADVISAAEAFGRPGARIAFTEPDTMPIFPIRGTGANSAPVSIEASRDAFSYPTPAPVYAAASAASSPAAAPAVDAAPADDSMSAEEFNEELLREGEGEEEPTISAARMRAEAELAEGDAEEAENAENAEAVFGSGGSFPMDMPAAASRISDAAVPTQYVPTPAAQPSAAPTAQASSPSPNASYCFPPLSLLKPSDHRGGSTDEEIKRIASSLLETLESFNVSASVSHVSRGPRITRYELIPKRGVRIRNIVNLQDDISMNLASAGIRIEAPIPGLAAVGVEVPNKVPTAVRLRDMLDHENFRSASSKTTICVGSDVTGEPVYGDVAKMPHVLIAGATGMGKSVCINAILLSLLFKAHPDEVKLILVDPKKVELNVYNGIPHLLVPVVVEPQKAAGALVWAVGEMERRFNMIETHSVRDIKGYNRIMKEHPELGKPLPQIVIVIDELNDLMMSARDAVEDAICRIAQKARAAGIHLLIGTQRPSVDVITGVIKANIPSRIAFHVSSQVDSRTILDMSGAEKLLNNGDMLFYPVGVPKPIRVQGAFVEDEEVEAVTSFLKRGVDASAIYDDEVMANIEREAEKCMPKDKRGERGESDGDSGDRDDLFSDPQFISAVEIAISQGQISTSKLQSKMRIGFQKATFFVDNMEEMGIVGPLNGAKPREVLISMAQFLEMKARH